MSFPKKLVYLSPFGLICDVYEIFMDRRRQQLTSKESKKRFTPIYVWLKPVSLGGTINVHLNKFIDIDEINSIKKT